MRFNNLAEVTKYLEKYIPLVSEVTGKNITIERMRPIMKALGNPEKRLKVIHVAGTSGKTSTTYYITALLAATGKKIGTTVSPHIDKITERVQINGQLISDSDFCDNVAIIAELIEKTDLKPTYFEFLIAFAYWYFEKVKVDYAVVETGFGGLEDSTNIAEEANKVCVITDIGYDHMHILGNTLPEIAAQKAGIIHTGNQTFMFEQAPEITGVFEKRAENEGAKLEFVTMKSSDLTKGLPDFQKRNWQLAHEVFEYLRNRDKLKSLGTQELIATTLVNIPARMDISNIKGKKVVMDGAHNGQKMATFVRDFKSKFGPQKVPVLLSLKRGKEHADVLPEIKTMASELVLTSYSLVQDTALHSTDLQELAAAAKTYGITDVKIIENQNDAYKYLLSRNSDILVVTGSFYLISQLRGNHPELKSHKVKLIAAIDEQNGIAKTKAGTPGFIPWRENIPGDQTHFRTLIKDGPVAMGWNTYLANNSKPFGQGKNFVFSNKAQKTSLGVAVVNEADKFLAENLEDIWVIGGGKIFELALPYAAELNLTRVVGDFGCDVFFPKFEEDYILANEQAPVEENGVKYQFQTWVRKV